MTLKKGIDYVVKEMDGIKTITITKDALERESMYFVERAVEAEKQGADEFATFMEGHAYAINDLLTLIEEE